MNSARKSDASVAYAAKSKVSGKWVAIHCHSECAIEDMEINGSDCWANLIRIKG